MENKSFPLCNLKSRPTFYIEFAGMRMNANWSNLLCNQIVADNFLFEKKKIVDRALKNIVV